MASERINSDHEHEARLYNELGRVRLHPWRELSAVALISLELSWLALGYAFFHPVGLQTSFVRIYLLFGANMAAAYVLARAMFLFKLKASIRRILLFTACLLATLVLLQALYDPSAPLDLLAPWGRIAQELREPLTLIPPEVMLAVLAFYLWARAVSLAHRWIGPAMALRSFSRAAVMLTLLGVLTALGGSDGGLNLVIFTLSGLLALGAARAASIGRLRGSRQARFSPAWITGILLAIMFVEMLALLSGRLASGLPAVWAAVAFIVIVRVVLLLGALLVTPLLVLLSVSWPWLQRQVDASPLLKTIGQELTRLVGFVSTLFLDLGRFLQSLFEALPDISGWRPWLLAAVFLLLMGLLLYVFGRRWRLPWQGRVEPPESSERVRAGNVMLRLARTMQQGWDQLTGRLLGLRPGTGLLGALRIRRLYARLMRLCAELGAARSTADTPLEFLPTLWQLFPGARDQARVMTEAYNRVRYGERPETRAEVEQVERAWAAIKQQAARLRHARREHAAAREEQAPSR